MKLRLSLCAPGCALVAMLLPAAATASTANTLNWSTEGEAVVCGVAEGIEGTQFDAATGALLNGMWLGLQCQAAGIPRAQGIGDPAVQLGQGGAGRARLVDISQDDLVSDAPFVALAPGSAWTRYGIRCTVDGTSVRCTNEPGYGFTISTGHVHLISPTVTAAPKDCGAVSYTYPHTDGHGHAALNNLTAVDVSCRTARSVASEFLVTGKPPSSWHANAKVSAGKEIFTRGNARVTGDLDN
jgi:hypothetical protein